LVDEDDGFGGRFYLLEDINSLENLPMMSIEVN
jgi:hypothetical protein